MTDTRPALQPVSGGGPCTFAHGCHGTATWTDGRLFFCRTCITQAVLMGKVQPPTSWGKAAAAWQPDTPTVALLPPGKVVPVADTPGICGCGCGTPTRGRFAPGHDAKLKAVRRARGLDPYTGSPMREGA